jgi:hypothetical protein
LIDRRSPASRIPSLRHIRTSSIQIRLRREDPTQREYAEEQTRSSKAPRRDNAKLNRGKAAGIDLRLDDRDVRSRLCLRDRWKRDQSSAKNRTRGQHLPHRCSSRSAALAIPRSDDEKDTGRDTYRTRAE